MKDHIIFEKLDLFKSTINTKDTKENLNKEELLLFLTAIKFIESRLKNTIPILVQDTDLTNASNDLENSLSNLNAYLGNQNVGLLTNSTNQIKSAITRIKNLPFPVKNDEFNFAFEIETFKTILSEKIKESQESIEFLSSEIDSLDEKIKLRNEELENLEIKIESKSEELDDLNKEFENQYDNDRAEHIAQISEQENLIKTNTSQLVEYLETKKNEASKIVNVIGNIGATGNFQKIANDHKKAANFWRWVAILLMAGLSGLIIWSIIGLGNSEFDWTKSLIRIIAAAALSYPATYASRESSKHRKLENYNRKLELELASIESFIEILPIEKKQAIKEKLADKYFGSTLELFDDTDLKSEKDFSLQAIERLFAAAQHLKG